MSFVVSRASICRYLLHQHLLFVNVVFCSTESVGYIVFLLVQYDRYVTYNAHLPQHALTAVHILDWVCQSPLVQPKIVGLLTSQADVEAALLHGFVECIESDEPEELQPESDIIGQYPTVTSSVSTRQ